MLNGTKTIPNLHLSHLISIFLPKKFNLDNEYIDSCNLCMADCLSDHNSGTPGPICLKFGFGDHEMFLAWF